MPAPPATPSRVAIFGATSDIAVAVARRFAEGNARMLLVARDETALLSLAADLTVRGAADVATRRADLSDTDALTDLADAAWLRFKGLDLAFIAYGTLPDQRALQSDPKVLREAINVNFTSPAMLCDILAARFEAQRSGTIAAITSVAGDRGRKSNYAYGAAKGGLQRYLEGLRHRLYGVGIVVLDIRPGFVTTKMTAAFAKGGPLWATPDKIADDIVAAIAKRRDVLYAPWFWRVIMLIVRNLPGALFHRSSL